jgi:hypothetical protein
MIEPWDTVHEKVSELRPDYWGTPEEVAAIAAPIRKARNRREATAILKEIAGHSPFISKSGLTARLQRRSVGKLVSSIAVHSSFSPEAHYLAAANIDKFFSNAIEPWRLLQLPDLSVPNKTVPHNVSLIKNHFLKFPHILHNRVYVLLRPFFQILPRPFLRPPYIYFQQNTVMPASILASLALSSFHSTWKAAGQ